MLEFGKIDWTALPDLLLVPACILLTALAVGLFLNSFINRRIEESLNLDSTSMQYVFVHALRGTPVSLSLGIGLYWIVNTSVLPAGVIKVFSYVLFAVIVFSITRLIARTVSGFIDVNTSTTSSQAGSSLLNNIANIIVYAMGVVVVLQYYGISIAPMLTALGVGGMAVALGLQDTLASIFAGLFIIISKQIQLNDYIRLSTGDEGRVTDITWRYTTILSALGNQIVVPNRQLSNATIINYSEPARDITIQVPVGVSYDSDLEHVERVTLAVANDVMQSVDGDIIIPPAVRFHTFSDSSIDFNVLLHSSRFEQQVLLKHEFIKALMKRYREENIEIPFPVRTIINEKK